MCRPRLVPLPTPELIGHYESSDRKCPCDTLRRSVSSFRKAAASVCHVIIDLRLASVWAIRTRILYFPEIPCSTCPRMRSIPSAHRSGNSSARFRSYDVEPAQCIWRQLQSPCDCQSNSRRSPFLCTCPSAHQATAGRDLCHSYTGQLHSYVLHKPQAHITHQCCSGEAPHTSTMSFPDCLRLSTAQTVHTRLVMSTIGQKCKSADCGCQDAPVRCQAIVTETVAMSHQVPNSSAANLSTGD
jgi:hypothetical protein